MSEAAQARDALRVKGEAVPWPVAAGLSALGVLCALGVALRVGPIGASPAEVTVARAEAAPIVTAARPSVENVVVEPVKPAVAPVAVAAPEQIAAPEKIAAVEPAAPVVAPSGCPEPVAARFVLTGVEPRGLSTEALARMAAWVQAHPDARVQARGYCDKRGSATLNQTIGRRRARALAEALEARGVPAARIEIKSIGARVVAGKSALGSANRRAELVVVDAACPDRPPRSNSERRAW